MSEPGMVRSSELGMVGLSEPGMVVFDLDGTLVSLDPPPDDLERLRSRLTDLAARHNFGLSHRGVFRIYTQLREMLGDSAPAVAAARQILDEHETSWARTTARSLLDARGAELLTKLADRCAVVTNNGSSCVAALVDRGLLPGSFAAVVTRDAGLALKPSPAPLALALSLADAADAAVWFVGDSDADERASAAHEAATGVRVQFVRVIGAGVNEALRSLPLGRGWAEGRRG